MNSLAVLALVACGLAAFLGFIWWCIRMAANEEAKDEAEYRRRYIEVERREQRRR